MIKEMNLRLRPSGQSSVTTTTTSEEEAAEQLVIEAPKPESLFENTVISSISEKKISSQANKREEHDSKEAFIEEKEEVNGIVVTSSRFPPISPLSKSNNHLSSSRRKGRTSNLIHRIRFSSSSNNSNRGERTSDGCSASTSLPLSPAGSSCTYNSRRSIGGATVRSSSSSSMIKSVKRALKPRKNKFSKPGGLEDESRGLLVFEEEHEVAPMLMHSFGTLDFSNEKEVDDDILVDVDEAIANKSTNNNFDDRRTRSPRSLSPVSVATEERSSPGSDVSSSGLSPSSKSNSMESKKQATPSSPSSPKRRWKKMSLSPSKKQLSPTRTRPPQPQRATFSKPPLNNSNYNNNNPISVAIQKPMDGFCRQVDFYDGQIIMVDCKPTYELGNYLGGGVAGVVYEGTRLRPEEEYPIRKSVTSQTPKPALMEVDIAIEVPTVFNRYIADIPMVDSIDAPSRSKYVRTSSFDPSRAISTIEDTVAVKILNPIGFRLLPPNTVQTALVVKQGVPLDALVKREVAPLQAKHIWWLINPSSRNLRTLMLKKSSSNNTGVSTPTSSTPSVNTTYSDTVDRGKPDRGVRLSLVAAYPDPETNLLKELPLQKCIEIWGHAPFGASEQEFEDLMDAIERINSQEVQDSSVSQTFLNTGLGKAATSGRNVVFNTSINAYIAIPAVPPKYLRWLRQRRAATKEIRNMMHIGRHKNVVHLYEVLELIQDSKSTMFLILEVVKGGELFDLISSTSTSTNNLTKKLGNCVDAEPMMKKFFFELASGIAYCHSNGIAHRDLKPENLLVHQDECSEESTLKIADFGLSATFAVMNHSSQCDNVSDSGLNENKNILSLVKNLNDSPVASTNGTAPVTGLSPLFKNMNGISMSQIGTTALNFLSCGTGLNNTLPNCVPCPEKNSNWKLQASSNPTNIPQPLRRMTSVVGSPHYVAPEIVLQAEQQQSKNSSKPKLLGYDGTKADVWSAGVILYAMLYRSLPFGEDLLHCPRYQSFVRWYNDARQVKGSRRSSQFLSLSDDFTNIDEKCLGPHWFFPIETSCQSRDLIMAMLNPDPIERLSVEQCLIHPWLLNSCSSSNSNAHQAALDNQSLLI